MCQSATEQTESHHSNVHATKSVDFNSVGNKLHEANSHSREDQWECRFSYSNCYEQ